MFLVLAVFVSLAVCESSVEPKVYSLHVYSNIRYRYAHTLVSSRIANPANVSQEVTFSLVLPDTAFISQFLIEVDGQTFPATVKEADDAKQKYDAAVQKGKTAGHVALSARESNRFTVSVNLEAHKKATFNLTYEEQLTRSLGSYKHIVNLDPGQPVNDLRVVVNIEESRAITSLLVPPFNSNNVSKANRLAHIKQSGNHKYARVVFAPNIKQQTHFSQDGLKGQFVVMYDVERLTTHPSEVVVDGSYFVHYFSPEHLQPLMKYVVFVLDISGSMQGHKIQQLKDAMHKIIHDLRPNDYFSLIRFATQLQSGVCRGGTATWKYANVNSIQWESNALPVTEDTISKADQAINQMYANGGTDIHQAMKIAVHTATLAQHRNNLEPIIIFLTDGEPTEGVTNRDTIVLDTSRWNMAAKACIFTLALGNDADVEFLKKLALRNCGFCQKIYEASDTAKQLRDFYKGVATPLAANINFNYSSALVDLTETHFANYYHGSELTVAGRLVPGSQDVSYHVTAMTPDGMISFDVDKVVIKNKGFMERPWAYLKVQQLLDQETSSYGQTKVDTRQQAIDISLKYSFVTNVTSLVVVKPDGQISRALTQRADLNLKDVPDDAAADDEYDDIIDDSYVDEEFDPENMWASESSSARLDWTLIIVTCIAMFKL